MPAATTPVVFNTVGYTAGGLVLNADGTVTVPVAGYYQVNTSLQLVVPPSTANVNLLTYLQVNGTTVIQIKPSVSNANVGSSQVEAPISDILHLAAGVKVGVAFYPQSTPLTMATVAGQGNYLSLMLLGVG